MPNSIILLDENTANRIAAGEVVERPASAVKELVENSIDSGATQILVQLEEGGKRRIEVVDNGSGMGPEDAVLALQRHATSKIRTSDDLFAIRTLGFRGEALPSIASVSHLTLLTKPSDLAAGARITVHGGDLETVEEIGARDGTTVLVEDLFYNTPARLKFVKSTPTETARAIEAVGHLAISHPGIAFRFRHGQQEVFSTPGGGDPLGALAAVWGRDIARKLIPICHETPGITVTGFICTPEVSKPGRSHELFYVNRRPIRSRMLGHALEEAFRSLIPDSRYPIASIFVDISPDLVDVNVHPTKTEVKFTRDGDVHHAVSQAIKGALLERGILPTVDFDRPGWRTGEREKGRAGAPIPSHSSSQQSGFGGRDFESFARAAVEAFMPITTATDVPGQPSGLVEPFTITQSPDHPITQFPNTLPSPKPFKEQLRGFKVLGQARNTYIVCLTDEGIAVIDQHVAHERVLYERLTEARREQGTPSQRLATPFNLALGASEAALLRQKLEDFGAAGWDIEPFGRDSFLVRSVPSYAKQRSAEALLRDMVDELANQSVARRLVVQREHVTITNACKMAVKAGDPLTVEEMVGLIAQLAKTENPYLCPHGRPIVVTIPFGEIDRKFKRA